VPTPRIDKALNDGVYFVTPTIRNWYYIFDRHERWSILADSLIYCQRHKGLEVYAYVFMLNHLHLIVGSDDVAGFLRSFKTFTSKALRHSLQEREPGVLPLFIDEDGTYRFWKADNRPERIESEPFFKQKMNYIHLNPVRKGYVDSPEHWKWSSANPSNPIELASIF
jgi:REP element-mobilizing transposase RayT